MLRRRRRRSSFPAFPRFPGVVRTPGPLCQDASRSWRHCQGVSLLAPRVPCESSRPERLAGEVHLGRECERPALGHFACQAEIVKSG
jgi:hypothetical protein